MKTDYKIILIGDQSVGKSALTIRFCENKFRCTEATISLDCASKTVNVNGKEIRLIIWDTAGQERIWLSLAPQYYRNVDAIVIVYDMTCVQSFKSLHFWLNECTLHNIDVNRIPCVLVGNKSDCLADTAITHEMGRRFAKQNNLPFYETSAKSDSEFDNVNNIFLYLANQLVNREAKSSAEKVIDKNDVIHITKTMAAPKPPKKSDCC